MSVEHHLVAKRGNCNHTAAGPYRGVQNVTFLSGHLDGESITEGNLPSPRCVHFVLHAAVHDSKLYLRVTYRTLWLTNKHKSKSPCNSSDDRL